MISEGWMPNSQRLAPSEVWPITSTAMHMARPTP